MSTIPCPLYLRVRTLAPTRHQNHCCSLHSLCSKAGTFKYVNDGESFWQVKPILQHYTEFSQRRDANCTRDDQPAVKIPKWLVKPLLIPGVSPSVGTAGIHAAWSGKRHTEPQNRRQRLEQVRSDISGHKPFDFAFKANGS